MPGSPGSDRKDSGRSDSAERPFFVPGSDPFSSGTRSPANKSPRGCVEGAVPSRRGAVMDSFLQDLRYGLKGLVRAPRLTLAALLCTALGIGSAVFMFTLSNAVLLRLPPFPDAERLARVRLMTRDGGGQGDLSWLEFGEVRDQVKSFDGLEAAARTRMPVTSATGTERRSEERR